MSCKTIAIILAAAALSASLSFCDYLRVNDFTGGINTRTAPDKLKDNEAQDITNFSFGLKGSMVKRGGAIAINNSYSYLTPYVDSTTSKDPIWSILTVQNNPTLTGFYVSTFEFGNPYYGDIRTYSNINNMISINGLSSANIDNVVVYTKATNNSSALVSCFGYSPSNGNVSTINWNNQPGISLLSYFTQSNKAGYGYKCDVTNIFKKIISDGGLLCCAGSSNFNILAASTPFFFSEHGYINNIDDKEYNATIFQDSIFYNNVRQAAVENYYANSLRNIYFFGSSGTNYSWNDYTKAFVVPGYNPPNNIAYSSIAVSGNLSGTYNYAATYVYDNAFESNPVLGAFQSASTQNYTFGVAYLRIGGFNYAFQQIGTTIYITKTTTGNVFVVTQKIADNQSIFKAVATSQNIFFSTDAGFLYKLDLNMNVLGYYSNPNNPQFSITNNYIYAYEGNQVESNRYFIDGIYIYRIADFYIKTIRMDLNFNFIDRYYSDCLHLSKEVDDFGRPNWDSSEINQFSDFRFIDFMQGYGYVFFNGSSKIVSLYNNYNDRGSGYGYDPFTINSSVSAIDLTSGVLYQSRGLVNVLYNNNYQSISWATPNSSTATTLNFLVSSSDIIAGFTPDGTKVNIVTPSLNSITSSLNSYQTSVNFSILNGQMTVTVPTSNSLRVTARNIYRQKNGTGYYLLSTLADNQTTTYIDNISDIQQSVTPLLYDNGIPPAAIDGSYTHARLFYFTSDGTVWYSKINNSEAIPSWSYIPILSDSDDRPQRIFQMYDGLFMFFNKSIYYIDLSNTNPVTWVPRKLNTDYGCPYPNSIIKGKGLNDNVSLFYMAEDNSIRAIDGSGKNSIQIFDNIYTNYLSEGIQNQLELITDNFTDIYSAYSNYGLYINIPSLQSIYVWDMQLNAWTKYVYPIKFKYLGVADNMLLAGDYNTSSLYQLDSDATTDLGTPIRANYKSKIYPANTEIIKQFDKMWVRGTQYDQGLLTMNVVCNTDTFTRTTTMSVNLKSTANITTKLYNLTGVKGRDLQFEISGTPNFRLDSTSFRYQNVDE